MREFFKRNKIILILYALGFLLFAFAGVQMIRIQLEFVEQSLSNLYWVFDFAIAGTLFVIPAIVMNLRRI